MALRQRARRNATERFSLEVFEQGWLRSWSELRILSGEGQADEDE